MPTRFLVYPLLVVTLSQLATLVRNDAGWYLAQIIQRAIIFIVCGLALLDQRHVMWVAVGWGLMAWWVVLPALASRRATRCLQYGELARAAWEWRWIARLVWGKQSQVIREFAGVLALWSYGQEQAAEQKVLHLAQWPMPETIRGEVRGWHLSLLTVTRHWQRGVEFYESVPLWGTLNVALPVRLMAARCYAELGQISSALRCLIEVANSTRTVGTLAGGLWLQRVCVTALAGNQAEVELLLAEKTQAPGYRRNWLDAVWRGRCALRRGDVVEGGRQLTRALALTPANLTKVKTLLKGYVEHPETEPLMVMDERAQAGFTFLRETGERMAPWRDLMGWSQPGPVTAWLLGLLAAIYLLDVTWVHYQWHRELWEWGGNLPWKTANGQWWRPFTAVFLHGGWEHLLLNSVGLWMFGTAIERSLGWFRMLLIFVVAGTVANIASATIGGFDVSVGASGGINGLVAAFGVTVFRLKAPIPVMMKRRMLTVLGGVIAADMAIGFLEPQIDNTAHMVGLAVGFLLALVP